MMTIKVNQKEYQVQKSLTLDQLLDYLRIRSKGIAIAVNTDVIKKTDWENYCMKKDDDVLIIQSTQGG